MNSLFSIDNPVMSGIYKLIYCIFLCFLWLLCCIPVFTAGASTTALYYTVQKVIKHERSYVAREFFLCFRANFKQTTLVWLGMLLAAFIFAGDIRILKLVAKSGHNFGNAYSIFEVLLALELLYAVYVFSYFARFRNSIRITLKNSGLIAIRYLGTTIFIAAILVFGIYLIYLIPILILILPVVMMWFISMPLEKIYYRNMDEKDQILEDKRNMVHHINEEEEEQEEKEEKKK